MKLYALHDKRHSTPRPVSKAEALTLNQDNYGIFWVVNDFKGRRLAENLTRINYWYVEIDRGAKGEQYKLFEEGPLLPSRIVESARGYHAYWRAKDATHDHWKRIVRWGLVEHYGGDAKCSDPLRLLRAPGFLHHKREPFPVRAVWDEPGIAYTEAQMLEAYPSQEPADTPGPVSVTDSDFHVDARVGLPLLNGSDLMGGESFRLEPTQAGKYNIIREPDNYSTGCWVDSEGLIGGNKYGVTLGAWLRWYGSRWEDIKDAIKTIRVATETTRYSQEETTKYR